MVGWQKLLIFAFALGSLLVYADRTVLYPMLPVIGEELRLSASQAGLIASVYFLVYVSIQPPVGVLLDRASARLLLSITFAIAGLGMVLIGLLGDGYLVLLGLAALHGAGTGAFFPVAYSVTIHALGKEQRGYGLGVVNTGQSLGLVLGMGLAGPVYLLLGDWRGLFLALGLVTLLVAVAYGALVGSPAPASRPGGVKLVSLLRARWLWRLGLVGFCSSYGFWVAMTWGPTFFSTERGFGIGLGGPLTAVVAVVALPATVLLGRLSDTMGRRLIVAASLPMAGLVLVALAHAPTLPVAFGALVLYGITGRLSLQGAMFGWLGDLATREHPEAVGRIVSLMGVMSMASAVIAPVVSGALKDLTGSLQPAFYVGALISALGAFAALAVPETVTRKAATALGAGRKT